MKSLRTITCILALAAFAGGCGGADGVRRMRAQQVQDAAATKYICGSTNELNCSAPSTLMADGHLTNFSFAEYSESSGKWCDASGFHGSTFAYNGVEANSRSMTVDTTDESVKLSVMVSGGSYAGGGLAFESCLDASAFSGIKFTVAVSGGSLTGCSYEFQLQTFEQRPTSQNPPGGCDQNTTSCYSFPAARNLPAPSMNPASPTLVTLPFSGFVGTSVMPPTAQLVGLQWQVSSSGGPCTVELRIDDIDFIPAAASPPPNAGTD
jgi:hypothetical protein